MGATVTIEPACGVCVHSFGDARPPSFSVVLRCGRGNGNVPALSPMVRAWWKCEHFEREPGAEGDEGRA